MSDFEIRFAVATDTDDIMNFIKDHWKEQHILAQNKDFFLYEYRNGDNINFAIAKDKNTNELVGVCGFIKNTEQREGSDVWGSLWKVVKTTNPTIGVQVLEYINNNSGGRTFSACGIAEKTLGIYYFLGFRTGKLQQFYRLNDKPHYQVAIVTDKIIPAFNSEKNNKLVAKNDFDGLDFLWNARQKLRLPYKDKWYLEKRYCNHPKYSYKMLTIDATESLLIAREVNHNNTKVLRIVDFIGNENDLNYIGEAIQQLIDSNDYEYIDFYCEGIEASILENSGFKYRDASDLNVIPNYFEPFVAENIDIHFFTNTNEKIYIFKGDGDQDRPNFIN